MNRIFKTVWNTMRRCLVVVNEATRNKAKSNNKGSFFSVCCAFLAGVPAVSPAITINGNWNHDYHPYLEYQNVIVNGDFSSSISEFYMATSGETPNPQSMTINGNFYLNNGLFNISHSFDEGGGTYTGQLTVNGNAFLNKGNVILTEFHNSGTANLVGKFEVSDRLVLNGGNIFLASGNGANHSSISNLFVNTLEINEGKFVAYNRAGNGNALIESTINNVVMNGGEFCVNNSSQKNYEINLNVLGSFVLNDGTLSAKDGIKISDVPTTNKLNIGKELILSGGNFAEPIQLVLENGKLTSTEGKYEFSEYIQTAGDLNNQADLILNNANISSSAHVTNTGTLSFSGDSLLHTLIKGDGVVNIIGGKFITDHFENGSVNIQNGVATLNSLNEGVQHTMTGGELHTGVDEIFGSLGIMGDAELNVISLNATMPETIRTELTEFFKKYVPGFVKENLDQYASFTGGKIVLKVGSLTETQVADLQAAFKETFATSKYHKTTSSIPLFSAHLQYSRLV